LKHAMYRHCAPTAARCQGFEDGRVISRRNTTLAAAGSLRCAARDLIRRAIHRRPARRHAVLTRCRDRGKNWHIFDTV